MTTKHLPEPERWTERAPGTSAESLLGVALRGTRAATMPSERLLARVEAGLSHRGPSVPIGPRWRVAAATLLVLLALAGTVGASRGPLRAWAARHGFVAAEVRPASDATRSAAYGRRPNLASAASRPVALAPPPVEVPATPPAAPIAANDPAPRARASRPPLGREEASAPVPEEEVAPALEEARVLQRVFHALRSERGEALAALSALDDYDRRFPSGLLRTEASLARVEALLALGRRTEALGRLDAWDVGSADLPRAMRAARGELRAEAGRCGDATLDFATVLTTKTNDELGGRALYGRASCALRAGDEATATAALTRYLEGHADGPHAASAREALSRLAARASSP